MQKKGQLFNLVKSLTKSEKRYLRLIALQGNNSNYMRLFDAIDAQEEYDEKAIKGEFANEKFIKQLHVTKIYLTRLIMRALRNFHTGQDKKAEVLDLLRDIGILFRKELYPQCGLWIVKALEITRDYELYALQIELLTWQRKLLVAQYGNSGKKEELNVIVEEQKSSLQLLGEHFNLWEITINMLDYVRIQPGKTLNREFPVLDLEKKPASLDSRTLYHLIWYAYHVFNGDGAERAEEELNELIELWEQKPRRIKNDPNTYITMLNNKVGCLLFTNKRNEVIPLLEKIRGVPKSYGLTAQDPIYLKSQAKAYNVQLELHRDNKSIEQAMGIMDESAAFLKKYNKHLPPEYRLLIPYQLAYLYFLDGNYSASIDYSRSITETNFGDLREDIQSYSSFLNLMTHYELDNIIVLRYGVENCRRALKKRRTLLPVEQRLLKFFSKLSTTPKGEHKQLFKRLGKTLYNGMDDKASANVQDYIDLKLWVEEHC